MQEMLVMLTAGAGIDNVEQDNFQRIIQPNSKTERCVWAKILMRFETNHWKMIQGQTGPNWSAGALNHHPLAPLAFRAHLTKAMSNSALITGIHQPEIEESARDLHPIGPPRLPITLPRQNMDMFLVASQIRPSPRAPSFSGFHFWLLATGNFTQRFLMVNQWKPTKWGGDAGGQKLRRPKLPFGAISKTNLRLSLRLGGRAP